MTLSMDSIVRAGYLEIAFLDSGGYETMKDHKLSELRAAEIEEYSPHLLIF